MKNLGISKENKGRGVGVILRDKKILLMHRIKDGEEYFTFPGGGIENIETPEETAKREVEEEFSLKVIKCKFLFDIFNRTGKEYYFLIEDFNGEPQIGGPERQRMSENNFYEAKWFNLEEGLNLKNLFPEEARNKLKELIL
ncbi:MAG: NUDIX domain-containing protein [Minisyncoccia bacterium]|jgi:8-oxo-dGTP pyrophosphatase MutT (NUDIX family)